MPLSSLSSPARRLAALALLPLVGTAALVAAAPTAQAVDISSPVVISEVYGGGGNSGAPFTNDFIELYNKGDDAHRPSAWSVQYASADGPTTWSGVTTLTGSIAPGAFYLVQEASGGSVGDAPADRPTSPGLSTISATAGKVALVKNSTAAISGCGVRLLTARRQRRGLRRLRDAANDFARSAPAPALTNTTSAQRNATASNTGNNAADFTAGAPTPKAPPVTVTPPLDCAVTPNDPACQPGSTTVQDIQGSGFLSLVAGATVERVPGIVTAVRSTGSSQGFWIQQANPGPQPSRGLVRDLRLHRHGRHHDARRR